MIFDQKRLNLNQTRQDVETILGKEWVYYSKGHVVYETIIQKQYPHIDIPLLCDLYDDHRGAQDDIVVAYVKIEEERLAAGGVG